MGEEKPKKKKKKAGKRGNNEGTIYERSDGRWTAQVITGYDNLGKPKRKTVYGKGRQEVAEKLKTLLHEIQTGSYVQPTKVIFGDWLLKWLKAYKEPNVKPETYVDYIDLANKHILPRLGDIPLQSIDSITIQEFYNYKGKFGRLDGKPGGLSPRRLHMMHQLINGALMKAVKGRMIRFNPADDIELPSIEHEEFQTFSIDEVNQYLEALQQDRLYALFLLELTTGLRRGEILGIPRDKFNPNKDEIEIVQTLKRKKLDGEEKSQLIFSTPKTKKSKRKIPLLPEVIKQIIKFQATQRQERLFFGPKYRDCGLLFTSEVGTPIEPRNLNRKHYSILQKAELKHIRVHDLRHTVASLLLDDGVNPSNVSDILGHTKTSTTLDIYGHSSTHGKERAIARLGDLLKSAR
ncbi:tyrosine-type recombinase/integrase [Desulfosporosinus meridiei]|uniref:Site-specific recombinase XerD n=1 Tax=Desulfosporosinus meridiei (strain ATCC BAA-275 / DSM 13257 / KCTC 12902 / NCIMB 13706 / S10) TaxID=768704 RepID=J7J257_DESMD|nr:site-specific integrase [Desulfosporosinus meridiei]AFQ46419.1 site-specific recombinase XerD [Desulfosporosinus meridiei DSM 13257]